MVLVPNDDDPPDDDGVTGTDPRPTGADPFKPEFDVADGITGGGAASSKIGGGGGGKSSNCATATCEERRLADAAIDIIFLFKVIPKPRFSYYLIS
jgi:hypothetical protein